MITLTKVGNAIKFGFDDNPLYLNDGTIEVPVNSLSLLIDESNIATFKKSNGDAFLSVSLDELGMTKEQLIQWYKDNMVGGSVDPQDYYTKTEVDTLLEDKMDADKERTIAEALVELNEEKLDVEDVNEEISNAMGGLKLVKLTEAEYEALTVKDVNTLYFIGDSNGYIQKIGSTNVN